MVDLGEEAHFGRSHGVLLRKEQLEFEQPPYDSATLVSAEVHTVCTDLVLTSVGRGIGSSDGHVKESQIVIVRDRFDTRWGLRQQPLGLLIDDVQW